MGNCGGTDAGTVNYDMDQMPDENELITRFKNAGQGHVFNAFE
jgi:hypothetical protein